MFDESNEEKGPAFDAETQKPKNSCFNKDLKMYLNRNAWFKINSTYIYIF